jgi:hypothetical protein
VRGFADPRASGGGLLIAAKLHQTLKILAASWGCEE